MVAVLALAGSLIVATERADAQQQKDGVLLSNTDQSSEIFSAGSVPELLLQQFQTGPAPHTYWNLSQVAIRTGQINTPLTVTIRNDNNDAPGDIRHTLSFQGNTTPNLVNVHSDDNLFIFDAPASATLDSATKYWISIDPTHNSAYRVGSPGDLDEESLDGWSFIDSVQVTNQISNDISPDNKIMMVRFLGYREPIPPSRQEHSDADLPYSDETYGYVDEFSVGASSTGRMDATLDSGRRTGDWWKLRLEPHRRYRVEVEFGSGSNQARGGGIDVNYDPALWDHNRDDGRAFIEFYASPESYHLRVRARDMLNDDSATYYGPYTVTLTDISGITKKVSNTNAYSGNKIPVTSTNWKATVFITGDNTGGYKLSYVGTGLHNKTGANSVRAELWTHDGFVPGGPGSKLFDFERISAITGHPTARYTDRFWAPASAANLAAGTPYWVVFKELNSGAEYEVPRTESGNDNPGAASGWSIGSSTFQYDTTATSPIWVIFPPSRRPILLEIFASNVVTGGASEAVDQTAPEFQSATVDGSSLTLAYNETLDSVAVSSGAFTVNVNGTPRPVLVAAVAQSSVLLHLSEPVEAGEVVTVGYTVPTDEEAGRVQDPSGNAAGSFSGQAVTNDTTSSGDGGERSDAQDPPGVPESLEVALQQSGRLKATWNAPGAGSAPTGYTIQWKQSGDTWTDPNMVSETEVTKTSYVIAGLTDGVEYTARVVATRDGTDSAPSEEVTAIPQETTPPELSSASVDGAGLTLTFNEALDTGETPDKSAFAVTVEGSSRGVDAVSVSDSEVSLTLVTAVSAGDVVTVDYTAPTGESESRLQDLVGNAADSFSGHSVTNDTPAAGQLTASTHDAPASHDGNSAFTFELRFSEEPAAGFSYKTLRDHAFTVTGGEVVKARRLEKGRNVRWEISITPNGDGPVTIVLPATTDCAADGAVCTDGGRKLSPGLEFEVPGLSTPEITSGSSFSVAEGSTSVATLSADDVDTATADLTWTISGGTDASEFSLTTTGVLSFASSRDFETPDDANGDGVYAVAVRVSDGGRTDSADLTVTLTNVNEAPTADAGADQENVTQGDTVTLNGSGADPDAGEVFSFAWVQTSGATVTLSDTAAAIPTFTAPTGQTSDVELIFTLRVTDDEGLFAEDSVTVRTNGQLPLTPLTASTHDIPANHDGSTTFTFELRFSEEFAISYKTLRDNAFTATGGEVVKVRRLEKGKNVRWEISVTPDGNGPVTIVLPATTDCTAQGAVCTQDRRPLSNRLDVTVPGP